MANVFAIHSATNSLLTFLKNAYRNSPLKDTACDFKLLSSGELAADDDLGTCLSLYVYRITVNDQLRNVRPVETPRKPVPLPLDLHFMLTVWAGTAETEHNVLAWAMQQLYRTPVLDRSVLSASGGWAQSDVVQIIPAELSVDDMTRIWDALAPSYRLSVSYIARMIRIDADSEPDAAPVVAQRFALASAESLS